MSIFISYSKLEHLFKVRIFICAGFSLIPKNKDEIIMYNYQLKHNNNC